MDEERVRFDSDIGWFLCYRVFRSGCPNKPNHQVLEGGTAPFDWPGWRIYAPQLGRDCYCDLEHSHQGEVLRMIEKGEWFDLTKSVPVAAGPDIGWPRRQRISIPYKS